MASRPGNTPQKQGGGDVEPATKKAKIEVTDPQTSKQVGSGDVSEDLICLLCKEIFKDPIIIMCGHNFCRGCMDKAWKGDTFTCPDCKQVINNKMYITNQALANLVKKTAGAAPALPVKKAPVPTHCLDHDEVLKLFCKEDGALMCMICRDSPKHAIHSFLPITDAVEMYKIRLSTIVAPLEEAMKATEQLVDQQNEKIEQNDTNLEECEQHIVGEFEKVRDFLQEKQEALLVKLQDLRAEMQSAINTRKKSKVDLRRAIALAKEKMKETEALSFLTNIKSFMDQCEKQKKEALSFKDAQVVKELDLSAFKQPIQLSLLNEMKFLFAPDVQNHQKPPKKNPDTSVQLIQPKQEEMAMEEDYTQDFEPLEVAPPVKSASTNKAVSKPAPTSAPPQDHKRRRSSLARRMETVEYFTVEDLMMTVQAHPALYDKANPDHKNLVETRRLWEGIARRYCQGYDSLPNKQKTREVDKYKTKWRSVRDNYIKDLKAEIKEKRSGRGASRRTPYRYSNLLGFLRPILQPRLSAEDSLQEEEEGSVEPREPSPRRPIKSESIEEVSVGTPSTSYLEDPPSPRASSPLPPESTESCQAFTQRSRRLAAPLANKEAEPPTEGAMTGIYGLIKSQEQLVSRHIQEESQTALIEKYQKHIESLQNQLDTIHNHYWQQLQQQHNQMKEQLQEQRLQSKEQNKHLKDQIEQQQLILQRYETQLQQLQSSPSYFTVMALLPFLDQVPQHRLLECQFSLLEVVRGLITPAEEPPAIQPEQQTFQGWHQQYHG